MTITKHHDSTAHSSSTTTTTTTTTTACESIESLSSGSSYYSTKARRSLSGRGGIKPGASTDASFERVVKITNSAKSVKDGKVTKDEHNTITFVQNNDNILPLPIDKGKGKKPVPKKKEPKKGPQKKTPALQKKEVSKKKTSLSNVITKYTISSTETESSVLTLDEPVIGKVTSRKKHTTKTVSKKQPLKETAPKKQKVRTSTATKTKAVTIDSDSSSDNSSKADVVTVNTKGYKLRSRTVSASSTEGCSSAERSDKTVIKESVTKGTTESETNIVTSIPERQPKQASSSKMALNLMQTINLIESTTTNLDSIRNEDNEGTVMRMTLRSRSVSRSPERSPDRYRYVGYKQYTEENNQNTSAAVRSMHSTNTSTTKDVESDKTVIKESVTKATTESETNIVTNSPPKGALIVQEKKEYEITSTENDLDLSQADHSISTTVDDSMIIDSTMIDESITKTTSSESTSTRRARERSTSSGGYNLRSRTVSRSPQRSPERYRYVGYKQYTEEHNQNTSAAVRLMHTTNTSTTTDEITRIEDIATKATTSKKEEDVNVESYNLRTLATKVLENVQEDSPDASKHRRWRKRRVSKIKEDSEDSGVKRLAVCTTSVDNSSTTTVENSTTTITSRLGKLFSYFSSGEKQEIVSPIQTTVVTSTVTNESETITSESGQQLFTYDDVGNSRCRLRTRSVSRSPERVPLVRTISIESVEDNYQNMEIDSSSTMNEASSISQFFSYLSNRETENADEIITQSSPEPQARGRKNKDYDSVNVGNSRYTITSRSVSRSPERSVSQFTMEPLEGNINISTETTEETTTRSGIGQLFYHLSSSSTNKETENLEQKPQQTSHISRYKKSSNIETTDHRSRFGRFFSYFRRGGHTDRETPETSAIHRETSQTSVIYNLRNRSVSKSPTSSPKYSHPRKREWTPESYRKSSRSPSPNPKSKAPREDSTDKARAREDSTDYIPAVRKRKRSTHKPSLASKRARTVSLNSELLDGSEEELRLLTETSEDEKLRHVTETSEDEDGTVETKGIYKTPRSPRINRSRKVSFNDESSLGGSTPPPTDTTVRNTFHKTIHLETISSDPFFSDKDRRTKKPVAVSAAQPSSEPKKKVLKKTVRKVRSTNPRISLKLDKYASSTTSANTTPTRLPGNRLTDLTTDDREESAWSEEEEEEEAVASAQGRGNRYVGTVTTVLRNMVLWVGLSCLATNVLILSVVRRLKFWKYPFSDTAEYAADNVPTSSYPTRTIQGKHTDGPTDGLTDGPTDGLTDGPTDDRTDGPTDKLTDGHTDGHTDDRTDGHTDGLTDGPSPSIVYSLLHTITSIVYSLLHTITYLLKHLLLSPFTVPYYCLSTLYRTLRHVTGHVSDTWLGSSGHVSDTWLGSSGAGAGAGSKGGENSGIRSGKPVDVSSSGKPVDVSSDIPVDVSSDIPVDVSSDIPVDVSSDIPVDVSSDISPGKDKQIDLQTDKQIDIDTTQQTSPNAPVSQSLFTKLGSYFTFSQSAAGPPSTPLHSSTPVSAGPVTMGTVTRTTPRSSVGWCGFLSSALFLAGFVLLLGVLLVPIPAPSSSSSSSSLFGYFEEQRTLVAGEVEKVEKSCHTAISARILDVEKVLGDKITSNEEKLKEARDMLLTRHNTLNTKVEELEAAKNKLQDELVAIATLDRQQGVQLDGLYESVATNKLSIQGNTAEITALQLQHSTIYTHLTALQHTVDTLAAAQKQTADREATTQRTLAAHEAQLDGVKQHSRDLQHQADWLKEKYATAATAAAAAGATQQEVLPDVPADLVQKLAQITAELALLKTRAHDTSAAAAYQKLAGETTALQQQLNKHITDNSAVVGSVVGDVSALKIKVTEDMLTKSQLSALESKISTLTALQTRLDKIELSISTKAGDVNNINSNLLVQMKVLDNKYTEELAALHGSLDNAESKLHTVDKAQQEQGTLLHRHDKTQVLQQEALSKLQNKLSELGKQVDSKIRVIVLEALASATQQSRDTRFFSDWLFSSFLSKEQFDRSVNETRTQLPNQEELVNIVISELHNKHQLTLNPESGITIADINYVVRNAIKTFSEDKTGRADFALEALGGHVISTGCTEPYYNEGSPYVHFMNLPLFRVASSPNVALQPEITPGKCWAFKGHFGYMMIQLADTIKVTGFSMEHLPKSLSIESSISTAPKRFTVRGKKHPHDEQPHKYGDYTYTDSDPLQYFPVQYASNLPYEIIELEVTSNHGNADYTCLYRIRVHGKVSRLN